MKKSVSLLTALILVLGLFSMAEANSKMNVYALDGRVEVIDTMDFDAWHAVGWYSAPVMNVYALDGRSEVIVKSDFDAWHAVGWYSAPVMTVYAPDGRSEVIVKSDFDAWRAVGWSSVPVIPAPYLAKINEYKHAMTMGEDNFYDEYPDDSSINSLIVGYAYNYGNASLAYSLYDIDKNGIPELIFSNTYNVIDIYTLNNGNLVKLFKNCYFGDRSRLHILSDGTLLTEGSSSAFSCSCETYKLHRNGYSLTGTSAFYYDTNGRDSYMYEYDYLTVDEYSDRLKKYLSYSIFDELTWLVFVSR